MPEPEYEISPRVTVETFSSSWEAQLARAALEAEGIDAVIADEHFLGLYGALTNTLGGVRLQVLPEELDRAAELLRNRRPFLYVVKEEEDGTLAEEPGAEPAALVTVGRYYSPGEAQLARALLESEGIDACVLEERLPGVSLLTGAATALSRVEVHPGDAERALEVLAATEEPDEAADPPG